MGYLSEIELENFRNYASLKLSFTPGLTIFLGKNGQGKTNLLEAVYFLSLLRSFRCKKIQNLKQWKQVVFRLSGRLEQDDDLADVLQINYGEKRQLKLNGNPLALGSEFIRRINAVSFTPEDIELVKGAAAGRRQFLDILLSQLSPTYLKALQNYRKALKSRNSVLRSQQARIQKDEFLIRTYDQMLIQYGARVSALRWDLMTQLDDKIRSFCASMFPGGQKLKIIYTSSISKKVLTEEEALLVFKQKLDDNFHKDMSRGITHIGPHRDDLFILLNGKSLSAFGSEGQCRLASLVMKMSAAEILIENKGTQNIVLLIDDVLGELDNNRREAFLKTIMRGDQVFIACTEVPEYCKNIEHQIFHISEGNVSQ